MGQLRYPPPALQTPERSLNSSLLRLHLIQSGSYLMAGLASGPGVSQTAGGEEVSQFAGYPVEVKKKRKENTETVESYMFWSIAGSAGGEGSLRRKRTKRGVSPALEKHLCRGCAAAALCRSGTALLPLCAAPPPLCADTRDAFTAVL
ncbi:unnamed protein product [Pleuronectes platessa]|uniref:Uncharacterized protein n=1 Tax=Pleuronectes platessa TaxID=8262 RepID=A0A9N7V8M9_PLEPL|nr:unnamed protein product [Pleuronectes platessa]